MCVVKYSRDALEGQIEQGRKFIAKLQATFYSLRL